MAYGRLDVYWPDGKFETFSLSDASVSVGRSTGNTITRDTDTISRYHISITLEGHDVFITDMDSANGTFVDGGRIMSNEPRQLRGGEEVQIGHLRMVYHAIEDIPTLPMEALTEDTQRIEKESIPFALEVQEPQIAVPPGSHTSAELKITNKGDEEKIFTVTMDANQPDWFRVNRPQLYVDPGETASVLVSIKPSRRSDTTPGKYTVALTVALKDEPESALTAEIHADILPYSGFGMALASPRVATEEPFRLHLHNQGSAPLPITIQGRSPGDTLRFGISSPQVVLAPGQRQVVQGEIKPKSTRYVGSNRDYPFELMVRSRDEAGFLAAVPGIFTERPMFPPWAALTVLVSAVGIVLLSILALLLIFNAPDPTPEILSLEVGNPTVERGDPIEINWTVDDADSVTIRVDGEDVLTGIDPDPPTAEIASDAYQGTVVVSLTAINGDNEVSDSVAVTIELPMTVDYFEVTPTTVVRHTVQTLSLRWRVDGAVTTEVEGLEGFNTTTTIDPSYGAEAALEIPGVAIDNFAVTLVGVDEADNTITSVVNVDVVNAECTTNADLSLYSIPDAASNVVGSVESDATLPVDGRDDSGAWLRMMLPGGVPGWVARTDVTCAENFTVEALRIVESTTMPESTPEATPDPAENSG